MTERLQKWLAGAGAGSRRQLEVLISEGRITVDGEPAVLGQKITGSERVCIDGRPVRPRARSTPAKGVIYNKPPGEICTRSDPKGRRTVFQSLPALSNERWVSVGRLDMQTSGLLILITDGDLANKLMHPSSQLQREYAVRVVGELPRADLRKLRQGITLEDGPARFDEIDFTGGEGLNRWYRVVVSQGRNRVVRRLFDAVGCTVSRLIRVRYGPVRLPKDLHRGQHRSMTPAEFDSLRDAVGLSASKRVNDN